MHTVEHGADARLCLLRRAVEVRRGPEGLRWPFLVDGPGPRRRRPGLALHPDDEPWRNAAYKGLVHLEPVHAEPSCHPIGGVEALKRLRGSERTSGTDGRRV